MPAREAAHFQGTTVNTDRRVPMVAGVIYFRSRPGRSHCVLTKLEGAGKGLLKVRFHLIESHPPLYERTMSGMVFTDFHPVNHRCTVWIMELVRLLIEGQPTINSGRLPILSFEAPARNVNIHVHMPVDRKIAYTPRSLRLREAATLVVEERTRHGF